MWIFVDCIMHKACEMLVKVPDTSHVYEAFTVSCPSKVVRTNHLCNQFLKSHVIIDKTFNI